MFEGDAAVYARDHVPKGKKDFLGARRSGQLVVLGFEISISPVAFGWTKSEIAALFGSTWMASGRTAEPEEPKTLHVCNTEMKVKTRLIGHGRIVSEKTSGRSGC